MGQETGVGVTNSLLGDRRSLVEGRLWDLLSGNNKDTWEQYRIGGATNRVYRIPLSDDGDEFVVAKLLPSFWQILRTECKVRLRNLMYDEHDISNLRKQVHMEIEQYAEWRRAGLPVPRLIQTRFKDVRVTEGLQHPTLMATLDAPALSLERKLDAVGLATRSVSQQHRAALEKGQKRLVHREPDPKNMIVDMDGGVVYWIDLEQPMDYPGIDLDALIARAMRIFVYGVLYHREADFEEFLQRIVMNYESQQVLWGVVESIQNRRSFLFRVTRSLGLRKEIYERQSYIGGKLAEMLRHKA